ncbi:hypothetical protein DSD19_10520 [Rhodovulum sp. BSW8]|uniref:VPLPA-CTERM sorting domain-containing protein n=1 Tax=Rhodovulum sp. BSW8 TaxID=2259645 RepID=UPI000DE4F634|nr:VPLPA-CTERM sorting domain-containing protein [Rhodovulum sp. BSW8]RBO53175.1 hypothetical protein DSD19_10520 [Rhodovulum sp. BSW8]
MRILKTLAASAALALSAGALHAATLSFAGGTGYGAAFNGGVGNYDNTCEDGNTSCYNPSGAAATLTEDLTAFDAANPGPGLLVNTAARLTVTFLGKEASALSYAFSLGAGNEVTNKDALGTSYSVDVEAGALDFSFASLASGGTLASNDGTFVQTAALAFSKIYNGNTVYAYFDDSGAADDRDFDDMVVKIEIAPIPLPAGVLLLGTALGGLGLARRRKAAKA